jgi:hypothetical protein
MHDEKVINIYFQAVTKVSMAHISVHKDEDIEEYIANWAKQGFVKAHYTSTKIMVYIPWQNVVFCQYADGEHIH